MSAGSAKGVGTEPHVVVVGLGPAGTEYVSDAARSALAGAAKSYLRTARHPAASLFPGLDSFDPVYERAETFEEVYARIVDELVRAATEAAQHDGFVAYAVPGSPLVAERTVELLRADPRVSVSVLPALSFLDLVWERLGIDPVAAGVRIVDGARFAQETAGARGPLLVAQCWSTQVLSEIKLSFDDESSPRAPMVTVLHHLGLADERVEVLSWWDLDKSFQPDHLTSLYVAEFGSTLSTDIVALEELVRTLRLKCPWDREQSHASLGRHLLEESYEVLEAIENLTRAETSAPGHSGPDEAAAVAHLREELGDLLFQVVFHAGLAAEAGRFTFDDVARDVKEKLVSRHPHVFGDVIAETPAAVAANWEVLKKAEKGRESVTEGIPKTLPALALAAKLQRKAVATGLEVGDSVEKLGDLSRALGDLDLGINSEEQAAMIGELLFAVTDLARRVGVDPEDALRRTALSFRDRIVEAEHRRDGPPT